MRKQVSLYNWGPSKNNGVRRSSIKDAVFIEIRVTE